MNRILTASIKLSPTGIHRNARMLVLTASAVSIALMALAFWPAAVFPQGLISIAGPLSAAASLTLMVVVSLALMRTLSELSDDALLGKVKRANSALADSEQRFRNLFETSPDAIICRRRGPDGQMSLVDANDKYLEMFEYDRASFASDWADGRRMTPETRARVRSEYLPRLEREGYIEDVELKGLRPDGSVFPIRGVLWTVNDGKGDVIETWSILRDVSTQDRANQKIKDSEARFHKLFESSLDGVVVWRATAEGRYEVDIFNDALLDMFGLDRETAVDVFNRNAHLTAESLSEWKEEYSGQLEEQGYIHDHLLQGIRADGTHFPLRVNTWLARDENGQPIAIWGTLRDVSEQKKIEQDLKLKNLALEQTSSAIAIFEANDGSETGSYVNPAFTAMTGFEANELGSINPFEVITETDEDQAEWERFNKALDTGTPNLVRLKTRRKDGSPLIRNLQASPVRDENGDLTHWITISRDVTETHEAEEQLQVMQRALTQSPSAVVIVEAEGEDTPRIVFANEAIKELHGLEPKDIVGRPSSIFLKSGAVGTGLANDLADGRQRGEAVDAEGSYRRPDGSDGWLSVRYAPIRNARGEITHWISYSADATEKRETQQQLSENAVIIEQLGEAVIRTDRAGKILSCNLIAEDLLGQPKAKIIGRRLSSLCANPDEARAASRASLEHLDTKGKGSWEARLVTPQGKETIIETTGGPFKDENGEHAGYVSVVRDVTTKRQSESLLRRNALILEQLSDAVFLTGMDGRIIECNQMMERVLGFPRGEIVGRRPSDFGKDPEGLMKLNRDLVRESLETGTFSVEFDFINSAGEEFLFACNTRLWKSPQGEQLGWIGVGRDITAQVEAEEELRVVKRAVEQAPISIVISKTSDNDAPHITFANQDFEQTIGLTGADVVGRSSSSFSEDGFISEDLAEDMASARRNGESLEFEGEVNRRDGSISYIEGRYSPVRNERDQVTHWISFASDVTARHQAEQQRRLLERAIERAPVGIAVMKANADDYSTTEYINPAFTDMFGVPRNSLEGKPVSSFVQAGFIDSDDEQTIMRARETKTAAELEISIERPDRETRILDVSYTPVFDESDNDNVDFWIGVVEDRTEQRHEEQQRRILERAIEASPSSVTILNYQNDDDPVYSYVNPAFEIMSGYAAKDVVGVPFKNFAGTYARNKQPIDTYLAGIPSEFIDFSRRKDGTSYVRDVKTAAVQDDNGQTTHLVTISNDVTERFENEQRMRKLQLAIEQNDSSVNFWDVTDEGLKMSYANEAFLNMTGYSRDELMGQTQAIISSRDHGKSGTIKEWGQAIAEGRSTTVTVETQHKDGTWFVREVEMTPVRDRGGEIFSWLTISRDVTKKIQDEARLWKLENAVKQTDSAVMITEPTEDRNRMEISFVNPAFERMIGLSEEDMVGKRASTIRNRNLSDHDVLKDLYDAIQQVESKDVVIETQRSDGSWFTRHLEVTPVRHIADDSISWIGVSRDVTQQMENEKRLRILERALEQSPTAISVVDGYGQDSRYIYANPAFERMSGFERDNIIGHTNTIITNKSYADVDHVSIFRDGVHSNTSASALVQTQHKDGHWYHRDMTIAPVSYENGDKIGWMSISTDVSDRIERDERLRTLERAIEQSPTAVAVIDWREDDTRYVYVNPAFEHMTGYTDEELAGLPFSTLESRDYGKTNSFAALKQGFAQNEVTSAFMETRHKDGHWYIREMTIAPIFDDNGINAGWVSISTDVTERLENEERLKRDALILQTLGEAVTFTDPNGKIVECNAGAERIFGRTEDDLIGATVADMMVDREAFLRDQPSLLARAWQGKTIEAEISLQRSNGEEVLIEYVSAPFLSPDGEFLGLVTVARDITEKRVLEEQLQHAQKMEAVGQLTGGIAHDFNNLMGVISGSLQLIESETEDWAFVHDMAATANKSTLRGRDLVDRLLAFSRRQTLQPVETNVAELLTETADLLERSLGENIKLSLNLDSNIPGCLVDQAQLESAIVNLAINARDAMNGTGHLTISATEERAPDDADSELSADTSYVSISVQDTGSGINEETLGKIFEPFFTTKGVGEGSGLGLSMVYGFAKQSGGQIEVESELGKGTCFKLYFPAIVSSPDTASDQIVDRNDNSIDQETAILVVEDNPEMLKVSSLSLTRMGYRVVPAASATNAMSQLTDNPDIRVAFIDIMLPDGMTGTELAKLLISVRPNLRVLFTSGYSDQEVLKDALDISSVVRKPFDLNELREKLATLTTDLEPDPASKHSE